MVSRKLTAIGAFCGMLAPQAVLACPVCFGRSDSPMATGMNMAILALLGITGGVLTAFAAFFVYLIRRSRLPAAGATNAPAQAPHGGTY